MEVPAAFHVLAKSTGAICNLACDYCFFLSKEQLYPDSTFRMPEPVLGTYLRRLLESHQDPQVTIAWQGGELTMMGVDFYRSTIGAGGQPHLNYLCPSYKEFFSHVDLPMRFVAAAVRSNRPADGVMA